jgi:hypothetical protein
MSQTVKGRCRVRHRLRKCTTVAWMHMLTVQAAWLHKIEGARLVYYSSTFIVERLWGKGTGRAHHPFTVK